MSQNDSLLDVYIYENLQLLEQLEGLLLTAEKNDRFVPEEVDAIFRILHTIKGSSAMMSFDNLAKLSHAMEDLFGFIRDDHERPYDHRKVCDLVFAAQDFLSSEIDKLQNGTDTNADPSELLQKIEIYYKQLKSNDIPAQQKPEQVETSEPEPAAIDLEQKPIDVPHQFYKVHITFQTDCKMENIRAFGVIKSLDELCQRIITIPEDVLKEHSEDIIIANGFSLYLESNTDPEALKAAILRNFFIQTFNFDQLDDVTDTPLDRRAKSTQYKAQETASPQTVQKQNYMSVKLDKLDKLMDLVGEIVITETTVTKNPEVLGLHLDSFDKASRQLRKLTDELQDTVMSIRMIPISATFHKLERIVRDMCKKTNKRASLDINGEDTEMDKNVIDNLSDPLMHIIRNSMDHGIEPEAERIANGKSPVGTIRLDAKNTGGDVIITVADDGRGLDRDYIIQKGIERGLVKKPPNEISDKEAYSLIFAPGFSTKDTVTEFSGRGVGMDVALKNVEKMGGSVSVDSVPGKGMTVQIRIPLTLAIIDGMQVGVGDNIYIVPILNIMQSFKPGNKDVFTDPDGNEMIMIRNVCYPVVRLHKLFNIETHATNFEDGILIITEGDTKTYCLFVDELIGEQQTVIKPMPLYISRSMGWLKGIAGCTILGDGSISLILDVNNLMR